jgi:vitamin B12 transporter
LHPPRLAGLTALASLVGTTAATAQTIILEDIVVSPDRAPVAAARTGASVSTLTEADLARDGQPFLLEDLAGMPGVAVARAGPPGTVSDVFVRGLPQRYVRVRVDGIEISDPSQPQVAPALSGLLVGDVGRAEVLRGSQSAVYGGQAVAGVIDITTPAPARDGLTQRVALEGGRYATFLGSYGVALRTDRADASVTLQRFQTEGFSVAEAGTEPDGYDTTRVSASGGYFLTDDIRIFGSAFWQDEDGEIDGTPPPDFVLADTDETYEIRSRGARAGADFRLGAVESTLAAAVFDIDRRFLDEDGGLSFGGEGRRYTVEYLGRAEVDPRLALQVGADWNREEATFLPDGLSADASIAGVFGQATWTPVDPLTIGLALRQDEHFAFGGYTTGRITAAWALDGDTILRASAGTGFRPPSLNELFGPFGGNPDLAPETSLSYDIGIEQGFAGGRARASATLFRVEIDDLITFTQTEPACFGFPIPPDATCYEQVTEGTSRSQGVELAARFAATERLTLAASYTYTESETAAGDRVPRVPRHDAALAADAILTDRITLGMTVRRVSDVVDGFDLEPLDDYTLVNARLAYRVTEEAEVYLRAENLLDEDYQTVRGYGTADRSVFLGIASRF